MIVMLDTSADLDLCEKELGHPVEEFFTPGTNRNPKRPKGMFAMDNGAFSKFNNKEFLSLLGKHHGRRSQCRFVALPDVVGSARRTLECFFHWVPKMADWPRALVAQDGQENLDIPWHLISAIFIGGSTDWKMSDAATAIIKTAQVTAKWCHVGRVNTPLRFKHFLEMGVDSIDGTGLARYSHMREKLNGVAPCAMDDPVFQ